MGERGRRLGYREERLLKAKMFLVRYYTDMPAAECERAIETFQPDWMAESPTATLDLILRAAEKTGLAPRAVFKCWNTWAALDGHATCPPSSEAQIWAATADDSDAGGC